MRMGLEIADALHRMYPDHFALEKIITLLGSQSTVDRLKRGDAPADIVAGWSGISTNSAECAKSICCTSEA